MWPRGCNSLDTRLWAAAQTQLQQGTSVYHSCCLDVFFFFSLDGRLVDISASSWDKKPLISIYSEHCDVIKRICMGNSGSVGRVVCPIIRGFCSSIPTPSVQLLMWFGAKYWALPCLPCLWCWCMCMMQSVKLHPILVEKHYINTAIYCISYFH